MNDSLLYFYLNGELTVKERKEVEEWIARNPGRFKTIRLIWELSKSSSGDEKPDLISAWNRINPEKNPKPQINYALRSPHLKNLHRAAAILIVAIGLGISAYFVLMHTNTTKWIKYDAGTDKKGAISLSDGSIVWLNKGSTVRYPEKFNGPVRELFLNGEAYFEIAHNPDKPFLIHAGNTITRVLGTTFNINASDTTNRIVVTVLSGKVAFYTRNGIQHKVTLTKGDKGIYSPQEKILNKQINTDQNVLAWKSGTLIFSNVPLHEVCEELSMHYDTHIFVRQRGIAGQYLTARFQDKSVDEILDILELTFEISCHRDKDGIELVAK